MNFRKLPIRIWRRTFAYDSFVQRMNEYAYADPLSRTRMSSGAIESVLSRRHLPHGEVPNESETDLLWDSLPHKEININTSKYLNIKTILGKDTGVQCYSISMVLFYPLHL